MYFLRRQLTWYAHDCKCLKQRLDIDYIISVRPSITLYCFFPENGKLIYRFVQKSSLRRDVTSYCCHGYSRSGEWEAHVTFHIRFLTCSITVHYILPSHNHNSFQIAVNC